ncbi:UNVERIFIED_CONTAM: hypothetical protein FKN15_071853 [Acipenser sinensis]
MIRQCSKQAAVLVVYKDYAHWFGAHSTLISLGMYFLINSKILCVYTVQLKLPLKEENGKETLKPDTIEVKVHGDNSIQTNEEDSKA